jgi:hypothetical protein
MALLGGVWGDVCSVCHDKIRCGYSASQCGVRHHAAHVACIALVWASIPDDVHVDPPCLACSSDRVACAGVQALVSEFVSSYDSNDDAERKPPRRLSTPVRAAAITGAPPPSGGGDYDDCDDDDAADAVLGVVAYAQKRVDRMERKRGRAQVQCDGMARREGGTTDDAPTVCAFGDRCETIGSKQLISFPCGHIIHWRCGRSAFRSERGVVCPLDGDLCGGADVDVLGLARGGTYVNGTVPQPSRRTCALLDGGPSADACRLREERACLRAAEREEATAAAAAVPPASAATALSSRQPPRRRTVQTSARSAVTVTDLLLHGFSVDHICAALNAEGRETARARARARAHTREHAPRASARRRARAGDGSDGGDGDDNDNGGDVDGEDGEYGAIGAGGGSSTGAEGRAGRGPCDAGSIKPGELCSSIFEVEAAARGTDWATAPGALCLGMSPVHMRALMAPLPAESRWRAQLRVCLSVMEWPTADAR